MHILIIIASLCILLVLLGVVYRILDLLNMAGSGLQVVNLSSNRINAILFIIVFIGIIIGFFYYSDFASNYYLGESASVHGKEIDSVFWIVINLTVIIFVAFHLFLIYTLYRYQYLPTRKVSFNYHNAKLEIIAIVGTFILSVYIIVLGINSWSSITSPSPKDALQIEIMGKQFNWQVRYPGKDRKLGNYEFTMIDAINSMGVDFRDEHSLDDFMPREIYLPKGRPILLKIRSRDVLHSVFLPHFRLKMDAVPGMQTQFWFVPTKTTEEMRKELGNPDFNYELACAEVCGGSHYAMRMLVFVEEQEDFDAWYDSQEPWATKNPDYIEDNVKPLKNLYQSSTALFDPDK